jgi:hypothetical protein
MYILINEEYFYFNSNNSNSNAYKMLLALDIYYSYFSKLFNTIIIFSFILLSQIKTFNILVIVHDWSFK